MGLLDALQSPDGQLGLGLLAAAGPSATPMSFGQRLSGAMQQFQAAKIAEEERRQKAAMQALQARLIESQIGETQAQALQRQAAAQEAQRKAAEAVRAKEEQDRFLSNPFKTQVAGGSFMTGSGERSPVENEQVQSASLRSARPVFDYASAARVFGTEGATKLMQGLNESRNFGLDEVARTADSAQGNRPGTIQLDKYGRTVGSFIPKAVEMKLADLGGTTQAYNPYELSNGQSFKKTQTADSVASNALGWSRLAWDKQKDARDAAAGQLVETPDGYVRVGKDNRATAIMAPTGVQPLMGNSSKLPESAQKQVLGARNVQQAVADYQAKLKDWSNMKMLSPDARAEMGNAYNNMMLQAKEAYNLGVLNGPDYAVLQSVVKDPTKLTSAAVSNEAMSKQASELARIAANIEKNSMQAHGKQYKPFIPNVPVSGVKFLGFE